MEQVSGEDVRGRARRRIGRLEERLGETRAQLDRSRGRRDELEHLLQRMVETETSRRDDLAAREQELERRQTQAAAQLEELEHRALKAEQDGAVAREELAAVRAQLSELRSTREDDQGLREELARVQSEVDELRAATETAERRVQQLEAQLSDAHEQAEQRSRDLLDQLREAHSHTEAERERRTEAERDLADAQAQLESDAEARTQVAELRSALGSARQEATDRQRELAELQASQGRLESALEQAEAETAKEQAWHDELEERLARTEETADSVLKEIDEELEISLGRAALERERRASAEARLAEATTRIEYLERRLSGAPPEPSPAAEPTGAGDSAEVEELTGRLDTAHGEIAELRAALEAERAKEAPEPEPEPEPEAEQVAEAEAESQELEQARRRILQLEEELGQMQDEGSTTLLEAAGEAPPTPDVETRSPVRDASELPDMSDEELAAAFSSMREAARLADDRDDRDGAQSYRALARAAAEEAANRPEFGQAKVRGRKKNRMIKELSAARERALSRRPMVAAPLREED